MRASRRKAQSSRTSWPSTIKAEEDGQERAPSQPSAGKRGEQPGDVVVGGDRDDERHQAPSAVQNSPRPRPAGAARRVTRSIASPRGSSSGGGGASAGPAARRRQLVGGDHEGIVAGGSSQAVSDQELGGAVEADVRQAVAGGGRQPRRREAGHPVGGVGPVAGALAGRGEDGGRGPRAGRRETAPPPRRCRAGGRAPRRPRGRRG